MRLDCDTPDTACDSIAEILGIDRVELESFLDGLDVDALGQDPSIAGEIELTRDVTIGPRRFTIPPSSSVSTCWFHATRVADPSTFRQHGIRPLPDQLEGIWEFLFDLVQPDCSTAEWAAFRRRIEAGDTDHSAFLYKLKVLDSQHQWGPFAFLVRDAAEGRADDAHHNYLRAPEITEDICRCFGSGLLGKYQDATRPCVVKFEHHDFNAERFTAAVNYLYAVRQGMNQPASVCNTCFDGKGKPVPPSAILQVDFPVGLCQPSPSVAIRYTEGEIGDSRYAREKFSHAVHLMTVGRGNLKDRLYDAFIEFVAVSERDIPPHLLEDYRWVRSELTKKKARARAVIEGKIHIGVEGRIGAALKTMRFARAEQIADRICYISDRLNEAPD